MVRERKLDIRLNLVELDHLRQCASVAGLPLRTFARRALLLTRVRAPRVPAVNLGTVLELHRIGVLLNQLTKRVHQGRLAPDLGPTLTALGLCVATLQADLIGLTQDDRAPA